MLVVGGLPWNKMHCNYYGGHQSTKRRQLNIRDTGGEKQGPSSLPSEFSSPEIRG